MMKTTNGFIRCNDGAMLKYSISGEGFPVVFVNGLGNLKEAWNETVESFERYFTVVRYNLRNQGKDIENHGKGYSTQQHAEDLKCLIHSLNYQKFVGVGISTGSRILSDFADKYPSNLEALVLMSIASNNLNYRNLVIFKSWMNALNSSERNDWTPYVEAYMPWIYGPYYLSKHPPPVAQISAGLNATMTKAGTLANISATKISIENIISLPKIEPIIPIKTLILQGEYDLMAPPKLLDEIKLRFSNYQLQVIEKSGHLLRIESREKFEQLTLNLLLNDLDL